VFLFWGGVIYGIRGLAAALGRAMCRHEKWARRPDGTCEICDQEDQARRAASRCPRCGNPRGGPGGWSRSLDNMCTH
jgi:hypothetical protein